MDVYHPISSSLTFQGDTHVYRVFFGRQPQSETQGNVGDLFFSSSNLDEARARIQLKEGKPRGETERIFLMADKGWTEMLYGRQGLNHTPIAKHPIFGPSYCLDEAFCLWKSKTWYTSNRGKNAVSKIISQERAEKAVSSMQNSWIFDEYVRWTSPPLSFVSPTQDVGKRTLTILDQFNRIVLSRPRNESTIQFGMTYKASIRPSLGHCIQDLMDIPPGSFITPINCIFGIQAPHIQPNDIIASIMTATDRANWLDGQALFSALNIPFTANGLGRCKLSAHPYDSSNRYVCARNSEGQIDWGGVLTPAGSITHPHIDYHGAAQFMCHIHGRKLWFTWPATTRNISTLLDRELRDGNPLELPEAIGVLEELDVLLLEDTQEAFYLPAGMIHAAISFTTCCHAGVYVWAMDEYLIARDLVNYHLSFATEAIAGQIPSTVDYLDVFCRDIDCQELQRWEAMAVANPNHHHSTDILRWIKHARERLYGLVKIRIGTEQVLENKKVGQSKEGKKRKSSQLDGSRKGSKRKRTHQM